MDALAKYIEIKNGHKEVESDSFNVDLLTASVLAKHTYDTLLENLERDYVGEYLKFATHNEIDRLDFLYARKHEYEKKVDDFLTKK
jgi:hypothetical protein